MKSTLREVAPWLGLCVVLAAVHFNVSRGAVDDLTVLYAGAWLDTCQPSDGMPVLLRDHLALYGDSLVAFTHRRFSLRLGLGDDNNYWLLALFIRAAERLGAGLGLRTVMAADFSEHLIAGFGVLAFARNRHPWVALSLLAGGICALSVWPLRAGSYLAFQGGNMSWFASAPRGAATLAWFGAVLAAIHWKGLERALWIVAFLLLSLACHRSMAILCFGISLPALGFLYFLERRGWLLSNVTVSITFLVLLLLAGAAKLVLLLHHGSHEFFPLTPGPRADAGSLRPILTLIGWTIQVVVLLLVWLRVRPSSTVVPHAVAPHAVAPHAIAPELRRSGDVLAALLTLTAPVCLGLNAFHPGYDLWYGPLFFLVEACVRSIVVPNALFCALAGVSFYAVWPARLGRATLAFSILASLLGLLQFVKHQNPSLPREPVPLGQLLQKGAGAYAHEPTFYFSVARAVATHGCSAPELTSESGGAPNAREDLE
jgi:hypothetical protein